MSPGRKPENEKHTRRAALYDDGLSVRRIALLEGVTVSAVHHSLRRTGAKAAPAAVGRARRVYALRAHGLSWPAIGRLLDRSYKSLASPTGRWARREGLPWPEADIDALSRWAAKRGRGEAGAAPGTGESLSGED